MSVLSLTFHNTNEVKPQWEKYLENELHEMVENLMDAERYLLSEVESDLVNEGQNTNLLLTFENAEKRQDFIEIELKNIAERIETRFGQEVLVFTTFLNPKKARW